jgi:hypothetical protein
MSHEPQKEFEKITLPPDLAERLKETDTKKPLRTDGTGPYSIEYDLGSRSDKINADVVARRENLDEAKAHAMELAKVGGTIEYNEGLYWETVNDGTKPGNVQVYQMRIKQGNYAGWRINGPHVDTESDTTGTEM